MSYRWSFHSNLWEPTRSELAKISAIIQSEEKSRIGRFHFLKDAKSSLIGRLLIRKLINVKTGLSNNLIELARDEHNKPILISPPISNSNSEQSLSDVESGPSYLNFNVSHQGDFVVLASDPSASQIGIDVMNIEKPGRISSNVDEYFRLMNRQFTENEWNQICSAYGTCSDKKKMTNFARFWCLKESYVKAIGVGIVIDLRTVDFQTKSDIKENSVTTDTQVEVDGVPKTNWDFEERFLDSRHIVAVAKERANSTDENNDKSSIPEFKEISLDYLLENMSPLALEDQQWVDEFLSKK